MQRVRIGLTGLAFVFLLVLLGTAISRRAAIRAAGQAAGHGQWRNRRTQRAAGRAGRRAGRVRERTIAPTPAASESAALGGAGVAGRRRRSQRRLTCWRSDRPSPLPRAAGRPAPDADAADQPAARVRRAIRPGGGGSPALKPARDALSRAADLRGRRAAACAARAAAHRASPGAAGRERWSSSTHGCAAAGACCCSPTRCSNGRANGRWATLRPPPGFADTGLLGIGGCGSTRRTSAGRSSGSSTGAASCSLRRARWSAAARSSRDRLVARCTIGQGQGDGHRRRRLPQRSRSSRARRPPTISTG